MRDPALTRGLLREIADHAGSAFPGVGFHVPEEGPPAGVLHGVRLYPPISGSVTTANDYPVSYMTVDDGVAELRLGFPPSTGPDVTVRFCPRYPEIVPELSTPEWVLRTTQRTFEALDMTDPSHPIRRVYDLDAAREDGTLAPIGGIVSLENQTVHLGIHRPGIPVVTFGALRASISLPLPKILVAISAETKRLCPTTVERLSFSILPSSPDEGGRPIIVLETLATVRPEVGPELPLPDSENLVVLSHLVMGHGERADLRDVLFVDRHVFDPARTREIGSEIAAFNERLAEERRPYVLIGPGRFGSTDPWLGVPVRWSEVRGAAVIVETAWPTLQAEPSRGMHFFRELVDHRVLYLYAGSDATADVVRWPLLESFEPAGAGSFVKWVRSRGELTVRVHSRQQLGTILRGD